MWLITFFQIPIWAEEPKDILSIEAYDMLNTVPNTYLIDVRTRAEYQLIGSAIIIKPLQKKLVKSFKKLTTS